MIKKLLSYTACGALGVALGKLLYEEQEGAITLSFTEKELEEELYNIEVWKNYSWSKKTEVGGSLKQADVTEMFNDYYGLLEWYESKLQSISSNSIQQQYDSYKAEVEVPNRVDLMRMRSTIYGPLYTHLSDEEYTSIVGESPNE